MSFSAGKDNYPGKYIVPQRLISALFFKLSIGIRYKRKGIPGGQSIIRGKNTNLDNLFMGSFTWHFHFSARLQKKLEAMPYRQQRSMDALNTEIQVLEAQYAAADCHEKNKLHEKIDVLNNELLLKRLSMERGAALDILKMSLSFALNKL